MSRAPEGPPAPAETPARRPPGAPDPAPTPERELIMHLEPDQLVVETFRPVPPARLGACARIGLWALRVFVVLVSAMVIYTFISHLH